MAPGLAAVLAVGILAAPASAFPPTLADAVRARSWDEVRRLCAEQPTPWPPATALVAARAERMLGAPDRAREILRSALRRARDLDAALRLELAEADLAAGRDPWTVLHPLLARRVPSSRRRAAEALLERAWRDLPVELVARYGARPLQRSLRRQWRAVNATRRGDVAAAIAVLKDTPTGPHALTVAPWLAAQPGLGTSDRLRVARALLVGGMWREADAVLTTIGTVAGDDAYDLAYLRGRTAYRLGRLEEAAKHFEAALSRAAKDDDRFDAAVQRARVAEIGGAFAQARGYWEVARVADPSEPAPWEGVARADVVVGSGGDPCGALSQAPSSARGIAGERVAALLLSRGEPAAAERCLRFAPSRSSRARFLAAVAALATGDIDEARRRAETLVASPRADAWRDLVLDLDLSHPHGAAPTAASTRDPQALARLAVLWGSDVARAAFARSLAQDPLWADLLAGRGTPAPPLAPEVAALVSVGLEDEAARLYAGMFPDATPAEATWSALHLARWGNGPAALATGETLWAALGGVPASLVPEPLLPAILPASLATEAATAAASAGCPPSLLVAVIRQESRFDHGVRSGAGAVGVAQFVPETARRLGSSVEEVWDADVALPLAAQELARLRTRFGGRDTVAAAAYNAGDAVVESWLAALGDGVNGPLFAAAVPYSETSTYVLAVREGMALARYLK